MLQRIDQAIRRLPPPVYLAIARHAYPLARADRRWPSPPIQYDRPTSCFYIDTGTGRFWFNSLNRVERYLWPDCVARIKQRMVTRYRLTEVDLDPEYVVVDVGANVGEFTLAAAERCKQVVSIEPESATFECMKRNTSNLGNVVACNELLSDKEERTQFYVSSKDADSSLIRPAVIERVEQRTTTTLDDLLERLGISRIDVLKVEAEGAEPEVLEGARRYLGSTRLVTVDCSAERNGESPRAEVHAILRDAGFAVSDDANITIGRRDKA